MNRTKIITAFYTDLTEFPFFCHTEVARVDRYLHSLRVLNNIGVEIICFCNETQYELLSTHKQNFNLSNVILKVSNLIDYKNANKMKEIKESTNSFMFYHEIDWNKIYLLEKEFDESYDYIYWVDVGLSHHGIFPNKYNPNSDLSTGMSHDYNTYSFTNAFNEKFIYSLNNFIGDKLLNLQNELMFHSTYELNRILQGSFNYDGLSIGGILGGHTSKLKWFISEFDNLANKCLNSNYILNHEAIISFMYEGNRENFKTFHFQTWYHVDTPNMDDNTKYNLIHFSDFFDTIFEAYENR